MFDSDQCYSVHSGHSRLLRHLVSQYLSWTLLIRWLKSFPASKCVTDVSEQYSDERGKKSSKLTIGTTCDWDMNKITKHSSKEIL